MSANTSCFRLMHSMLGKLDLQYTFMASTFKIFLLKGRVKLSIDVTCFTVPPTVLHGDLT